MQSTSHSHSHQLVPTEEEAPPHPPCGHTHTPKSEENTTTTSDIELSQQGCLDANPFESSDLIRQGCLDGNPFDFPPSDSVRPTGEFNGHLPNPEPSSLSTLGVAPTTQPAALSSQAGFFAFLVIAYVGAKGLSQLFAAWISAQPNSSLPILLTTSEYAMWVVLGSIYRFTLDERKQEDAEDRVYRESLVLRDLPLNKQCDCGCRCPKCRRAFIPEVYPRWQVSCAYLCGELIKTVLEVMTVAKVELSLALVLLGTAPLFSVLFRAIFEGKKPKPAEIVIVAMVAIGLAFRIPDIQLASFGAVIGGLVSAAASAWISSFKSLIFDPPNAPHVLSYMFYFGPMLMSASLLLCLIGEMSTLKLAFASTDSGLAMLSFAMLFGLLSAPSSVVSKRLQRILGSFQRTLLSILNNVFVSIISVLFVSSTPITPLTIIGSIIVFASPVANYVDWPSIIMRIRRVIQADRQPEAIQVPPYTPDHPASATLTLTLTAATIDTAASAGDTAVAVWHDGSETHV